MDMVESIIRSALPQSGNEVTYASVVETCQRTLGAEYRLLPDVIRNLIGSRFLHRELRRTSVGVTLFLVRN